MPFGATPLAEGGVRFRLWAPEVAGVELVLADRGPAVSLTAAGDGWFEAVVREAGAGTRYRFRVGGDLLVPDPASRYQPFDVHGPSEVVDPTAYVWQDEGWRGRPWAEAVLYELHVGTFTPAGSFAGVAEHLDHLVELGVTAIELMPVADFPGRWGWGYDGVLWYAPASRYGRPDELKALIDAAHQRGLMVLLDVVYNHFGPDGNYLHVYARRMFHRRRQTPWGAALDVDGPASRVVRDLIIHNALYWLEEFHLDGLRLDAVDAISDAGSPHLLEELAAAVHSGPGADRQVHLVLENDDNSARYLRREGHGRPAAFTAQWNDDFHHAAQSACTGDRALYYVDYATRPIWHLARAVAEGFSYQGEPSAYRGGAARGEPSAALGPLAFVNYLQTHDQAGNRPFGERLAALAPEPAVRAATALLLLAPSPPLLFMGQEWASRQPFLFFADLPARLGEALRRGRTELLSSFPGFNAAVASRHPDPTDALSVERSRLDWQSAETPAGRAWLELHRQLLAVRRRELMPLLAAGALGAATYAAAGCGFWVRWPLADGGELQLAANLGDQPAALGTKLRGRQLALLQCPDARAARHGHLPPWSVGLWRRMGVRTLHFTYSGKQNPSKTISCHC